MKKSKILFLALLSLGLIFAGFIGWALRKNKPEVVNPKRGPIVEAIYGLGTVQSAKTYNLKLAVTATLSSLFVKEGDAVNKGQALVQLDDNKYRNEVAPFSGTVNQINYAVGETLFPQTTILSLIDLQNRYVSVTLSQESALRVKAQQKASLRFENIKDQLFTGRVRALFPQQGQLIAHLEVDELPPEVLPGMTADVSITVTEKMEALLLPLKAIRKGQILWFKDGEWLEEKVELGLLDSEWAEILTPVLSPTDLVQLPKD